MATTLIQFFLETVAKHDKAAQFMRKTTGGWESLSARRALADVESLGLGLRGLGVEPGDHVAILSENRYEWAISDLAILGLGAASVPIYTTLTAEQVRYILDNAEAELVIVSTDSQLAKVRSILDRLPRLQNVLIIDGNPGDDPRVKRFSSVLERGAAARAQAPGAFAEAAARVKPDDLATIIYTSGTTGEPKGAMLTHHNIVSNAEACLSSVIRLEPTDTSLSFLPLSHIFERMGGFYCMIRGGVTIAYAQGIDTVAQDALDVKPTVMTAVPRFYEKIYGRVMESAASMPPLRRRLFDWGIGRLARRARARFEGRADDGFFARLADRLVASKIRARVGGRLRFCISGGAPLGAPVMEFFFAIGIPVIEGYGLTETSPVICLNPPGKEKPGSVGPPIPGVELRIADDGEILTRGPHVMRGYFKNEAATREAITDGWFHTGDVGHLDRDGYLVITDRLKDLLVTAGGKKVAPQPIELKLKTSRWVAEAVLLGDRRPFVACLIAPDFDSLAHEARARGWTEPSAELLRRAEVLAIFQGLIDEANKSLAPFEQIKRFALLERPLTQETGEITPSLKVKRRVVAEKFSGLIEGLYAGTRAPAAA